MGNDLRPADVRQTACIIFVSEKLMLLQHPKEKELRLRARGLMRLYLE